MIPGRASAALIPNLPSSDAKALSFDLTHSFKPPFKQMFLLTPIYITP